MGIVDDIKQKADIVDIISGYIKLQKAGRNFKAICPFHSEKTPSFFVFPEQQSWHCFGACSTGGDVFSFIMKKDDVDFSQALRLLAEKTGINIDSYDKKDKQREDKQKLYDLNQETAIYFNQLLLTNKTAAHAREYLEKRGISKEIIELFQLGYSKAEYDDLFNYLLKKGYGQSEMMLAGLIIRADAGTVHDRFRNRLMFPICDIGGNYIGFGARALDESMPKYMNSPQTPVFDKSSCLYGVDKAKMAIREHNQVIITEGYMDVLTSHQYGWDYTVASMGTALTDKQINIIKRFTKNIILALDMDTAGEEATFRIAETIDVENYLNNEVKVAITKSGKDPDEIIRKNAESWENALNNGLPLIDFIFTVIKARYDLKSLTGKSAAVNSIMPVIQRINDPIKRGEYIQRFAKILNMNENYLLDVLNKMNFDIKKKKRIETGKMKTISDNLICSESSRIEEELLSFLLQNPELREEGIKIPVSYFESTQNAEIFRSWCKYNKYDDIKSNTDPAIHLHLDKLINKPNPPAEQFEGKMKLIFFDYVDRLHEKHIRNIIKRKAEFLLSESKLDSDEYGTEKMEQQFSSEVEEFKKIFAGRKQRRQIQA